jgi:hypothetical protein
MLPPNVTLVSAPPGSLYTNGTVFYTLGMLASGSSTSFTISVMPTTADPVTNILAVSSVTSDPSMANNTATVMSLVSTSSPPLIYLQPADVLVPAGNTANFQVTAAGPPPLSYQWFFNDLSLTAATNTLLSLSNVQNPQAGPYFVIVNNSQGSVTSTIAHLTLLLPPTISLPALNTASNMLSVNLASISGGTYILEYKNSLQDSNWTALPPPVTGTGGTITLQDTNGFSLPTRFYRVRAY